MVLGLFPPRVGAGAFGDLTIAVLVGVGAYQDSSIRPLQACAPETERLARALIDPGGCRIPERNVDVMVDARATRSAVTAVLRTRSAAASSDQILIVYFAGHGEQVESGFGLLLHDTKLHDIARTALTSSDLDEIFVGCKARGVLMILDCCGGAALAESAPAFMQQVGQHEFRILLSASRANQSSWETPAGSIFTRHLLDVVEGTAQVSPTPGQVYFNDLLRHLRHSVSEEIANAQGRLPPQEPVFNGGYVDDPLIFVHTGETLKQIRVKVQRYSQSYVRARIRLTTLLILGAFLVGIGGLWLLLDQHYYLQAGDRAISLFHGYPGVTGLGYPKLLWTAELQRNLIKADSLLRNDQPVVVSRRQPAFATIHDELSPTGQALWWVWAGQRAEARRRAKTSMKNAPSNRPNDWAELAQLFAANATQGDLAQLVELSRHQNPSVVQSAIHGLAHLNRSEAIRALSRRGFEMSQVGIHLEALKLWDRPCDSELRDYLNTFERAPSYSQFTRATILTALRAECMIDIDPLLAADPAHQAAVATYWTLHGGETPNALALRLRTEIGQAIARMSTADGNALRNDFASLPRMVEMALALPKAGCPVQEPRPADASDGRVALASFQKLMSALDRNAGSGAFRYVRTRLAAYIAAACAGIRVTILTPTPQKPTQWSITLAAGAEPEVVVAPFSLEPGNIPIDIVQLAEYIVEPDQAERLQLLAAANLDGYWKSRLVRRLRLMKVPASAIETFFTRGEVELQIEAYLWHAASDHAGALRAALARLNDPTATFLPSLLTLLAADTNSRAEVMRLSTGAISDEARRTALVTLFGTKEQVAEKLAARDVEIRAVAIDYLDFRDDLLEISTLALPRLRLPTFFSANFSTMAAHRDRLRNEIASTPDWALPIRSKLILDLRNDLSNGMRLWIEREARRRTEDLLAKQ